MVCFLSVNDVISVIGLPQNGRALANARQLLAHQHIHDALAAKTGLHVYPASPSTLQDLADIGCFGTQRVGAHGGQGRFGLMFRHHRNELAFVGQIQGVESEDFAKAFYFGPDRGIVFRNFDGAAGRIGLGMAGAMVPAAQKAFAVADG